MKKSKITKEEWDKRDLTDILNKYDMNVYDFMNYLIEFELPALDLNYKVKVEEDDEMLNNKEGDYSDYDGEDGIYNN